jgi:hypothetical protein
VSAGIALGGLLGACGQLSGLSAYTEEGRVSDASAFVDVGAVADGNPNYSRDARVDADPTTAVDAARVPGDASGEEGNDATAVEDALREPDAMDAAGNEAEAGCSGGFITCAGACVDPSNALNCGSCGNACSGDTPVCAGSSESYACSSGCPSTTPTLCGSTCVDEQTDVDNCNGCGNPCPGVANGEPACIGSACTFACNSGYSLCGSTCVDEQTDVDNCNGCGNACPGVADGQPACVSGACTFTCSGGYSPCGGACVALTTTTNCGACGNTCSGGTQFCLGSGSSYSCGGTFGGIYSDVDTTACSAIAQTCNTGVYLGNPLDANACGCPSGYSTSAAMNVMNDQAGGNCGNGIWGWGSMHTCYSGTSTTLTSANDFGGFYQTVASNCATPAPAQTCEVGNPLVAGGGCSCPTTTGWKTITMRVDGSNWAQGTIDFCWNSSASLTTFGGAYEGTDPGTGYGGATSTTGGCLVGNPAVTGTTCNCPSGTSAISIRSIYGTPQAGCGNAGQDGSHVFVCVK